MAKQGFKGYTQAKNDKNLFQHKQRKVKKGRLICFCVVNFKSKKVNVNKYSSFQLKEKFKK